MVERRIQTLIDKTYKKVKTNNCGTVADYIPQLAKANPKIFGIAFVSCNGDVYHAGDYKTEVPIESISKAFSLALAVEDNGINVVNKKIGNEGSSLPFNDVVATVLSKTHTINPFVNQGAMATTSLSYNKSKSKFRNKILGNLDKYAGRDLSINKLVYESESKTNQTNMALAYLLKSYDRFYGNVEDVVDVYTEQCSKNVSALDIATMACVFAKGGIHPNTNKRIISESTASYVNRALKGEGLYEYSGKWETDVGCISAKSGVGGGFLIILKGVGGIGIVSPPLDKIGNSVRGVQAGTLLSNGIYNIFNTRTKFCNTVSKGKPKKERKTRKVIKSKKTIK